MLTQRSVHSLSLISACAYTQRRTLYQLLMFSLHVELASVEYIYVKGIWCCTSSSSTFSQENKLLSHNWRMSHILETLQRSIVSCDQFETLPIVCPSSGTDTCLLVVVCKCSGLHAHHKLYYYSFHDLFGLRSESLA